MKFLLYLTGRFTGINQQSPQLTKLDTPTINVVVDTANELLLQFAFDSNSENNLLQYSFNENFSDATTVSISNETNEFHLFAEELSQPIQELYIRVRSTANGFLNSDFATYQTDKNSQTEINVTNFQATAGDSVVNLSWDTVNNISELRLFRNGVLLSTLNTNATTYEDLSVVNDTQYTYYSLPVAVNFNFIGVQSPNRTATPVAVITKLSTPTGIQFFNLANGEFDVIINTHPEDNVTYVVEQDLVQVHSNTSNTFKITGAVDNTQYSIRVKVTKAGFDDSDWFTTTHLYTEPVVGDFDANFIDDFGADPFYRRLWYGEITTNGTSVTIASGGLTSEYVGKRILIKHTRVGSKTPYATYFTITSIQSATECTIDNAPQFDVTDEAGYIFFDNTQAFRNAFAVANTSGKNYKIFVPNGTYVIPNYNVIEMTNGAPQFISTQGVDTYGNASFKFIEEEVDGEFFGVMEVKNVSHLGPYELRFENINLIVADNYSYKTNFTDAFFRFPSNGTPVHSGKLSIINCNMGHEFELYQNEIDDYITNKYEPENDDIKKYRLQLEWLFARPSLIESNTLSDSVNDFEITYDNCKLHVNKVFQVVNSIYTQSSQKVKFNMKNTNYRGQVSVGRSGLTNQDLVKPLVNIVADTNGEYTKVELSQNSPVGMNFTDLRFFYDAFSGKRLNVSNIYIKFKNIQPKLISSGHMKSRDLSCVELGTVTKIHEINNVCYITIDNPLNIGSLILFAFERDKGVVQFDDVGSDLNSTLQNGSFPNNGLINSDGELIDYRGWVRNKCGETGQNLYNPTIQDPLGRGYNNNEICIDYEESPSYIVGDLIYLKRPETTSLTVEANTNKTYLPDRNHIGSINDAQISHIYYNNEYIEILSTNPFSGNRTEIVLATPIENNTNENITINVQVVDIALISHISKYENFGNVLEVTTPSGFKLSSYYSHFYRHNCEVYSDNTFLNLIGTTTFTFSIVKNPLILGNVFDIGENVYAWWKNTGNVFNNGDKSITRLQPNHFNLYKWDAFDDEITDLELEYMTFNITGNEGDSLDTHFIYGSSNGSQTILYNWENVNNGIDNVNLNENISNLFRRANARTGSTFKNCNLVKQELGNVPIILDGGSMSGVFTGSQIQTRNNPSITGNIPTSAITPLDNNGYTLNGVFYPS